MGAKCVAGRTFQKQQIEGTRPFCENLTERLCGQQCALADTNNMKCHQGTMCTDCSHWKPGDQQKKKIIKVDPQIILIKDLVYQTKGAVELNDAGGKKG